MNVRTILKISFYIFSFLGLYAGTLAMVFLLPLEWGILWALSATFLFFWVALYFLDMTIPGVNFLSYAPIRFKNHDQAKVAITFDDGPFATTPEILNILANKNVKASFFWLGKLVEQNSGIAKRAIAEGHTVASHSYDHKLLPFLSNELLQEDFRKTQSIFENIGLKPKFFRCPKGYKSRKVAHMSKKEGMAMIGFSYHLYDLQNPPASELVSRVLKKVRPGDILLLHEGSRAQSVVAALPDLIDGLAAKGLKPVSLSEIF